jgi:AcrR family transcriptional regulator
MHIQPRLFRAHVDNRSHNRPMLTDKQREREQTILAAAQTLMATYSRGALTIGKLAIALRMSPGTIRRHFADIDSILAEILLRHLTGIARAIGRTPPSDPKEKAAARAAYIEATRTGWGGLTEPHLLLIRERHTLPEDLAKPVEDMRTLIGEILAGERGAIALTLLDTPELQATQIDAMLATTEPKATEPTATEPRTANPEPPAKPAEPQAPATAPAAHKPHYQDWKAAKRHKKLQARNARAGPASHSLSLERSLHRLEAELQTNPTPRS